MGLFSKDYCAICGRETVALSRLKLNDGSFLCGLCMNKLDMTSKDKIEKIKNSTFEEVKVIMENDKPYIDKRNELIEQKKEEVSSFKATKNYINYIMFDDNLKKFAIPKMDVFEGNFFDKTIFDYDSIVGFELLEDGETDLKGGFGKAVVGTMLLGAPGAIAGGTSKKMKPYCTQLEIKITIKNSQHPAIFIKFISSRVARTSFTYKTSYKTAQEIMSKLQIIVDELENSKVPTVENPTVVVNQNSAADEIRKYKELLDAGAISKEEYEDAKNKLLGLTE